MIVFNSEVDSLVPHHELNNLTLPFVKLSVLLPQLSYPLILEDKILKLFSYGLRLM